MPFENTTIKYGVMSRDALLADCLDWESLYAAGRLHKPVRLLEMDANRDWVRFLPFSNRLSIIRSGN